MSARRIFVRGANPIPPPHREKVPQLGSPPQTTIHIMLHGYFCETVWRGWGGGGVSAYSSFSPADADAHAPSILFHIIVY